MKCDSILDNLETLILEIKNNHQKIIWILKDSCKEAEKKYEGNDNE